MKIHEFYRDSANITLNGSIAALVPAIIIGVGNLYFFQNNQIMLLTIPFVIYSFISFQIYLFRMKQAITIDRNMPQSTSYYENIFSARHLVVVYMNQQESSVHLFFPDGHQAGMIKRYRQKGIFRKPRIYALYDNHGGAVGFYRIKKSTPLMIAVYDQNKKYLGCYEKERLTWLKTKKEMMDESGKFIGSVEGSKYFMDECVLNQSRQQVGRLRRGWMPLEWSGRFPEPNTPVLTLFENLSEKDKLLTMSFLINEYFIER
ncbi:hypothetical protein ACIQAA_00315 [Neobacillus sp. NPDC093182]|uniref:hypothetical protein n=1 Tax=Neobacillus sp. NPDC093182 TaxID=3364297 RepID=UPI003804F3B5